MQAPAYPSKDPRHGLKAGTLLPTEETIAAAEPAPAPEPAPEREPEMATSLAEEARAAMAAPDEEEDARRSRTDWVLVSRDPAALKRPEILARKPEPIEDKPDWRTRTDDYSNLIQILK